MVTNCFYHSEGLKLDKLIILKICSIEVFILIKKLEIRQLPLELNNYLKIQILIYSNKIIVFSFPKRIRESKPGSNK
ncbi:hypothetical protein BpHYR1_021623 [Brachionus plicatilis]|uniref:Uncharacterized protein n=1 Tax=Brachionus plicatilis TaxID=10195 RepID=A0A3M7PH91_BRAPC|nr:hypothetical protein BpHYR1_021623 [Brachionus plicatilis]